MADACSMPSSKPTDENGRVHLTRMTEKGGWAAKWSPGDLQEIMKKIAPTADPELLLGFDTSDDAAVYRIVCNTGVQADDVLFYTKKIGSGIMNSAYRAGFETPESTRGVLGPQTSGGLLVAVASSQGSRSQVATHVTTSPRSCSAQAPKASTTWPSGWS